MNKIKVGKIANKITSVIFVVWLIFTIGMPTTDVQTYIIISGIFVVLFSVTTLVGMYCLKGYKEEDTPKEFTE